MRNKDQSFSYWQEYKRLWRFGVFVVVLIAIFSVGIGGEVHAQTKIPDVPDVKSAQVCGQGDTVSDSVCSVLSTVLQQLLELFAYLFAVFASVLAWVVDPGSLIAVLNTPFLFTAWSIVRDILNLMFILVLLFSAFATIFQIERFHIKRTILMVVMMALLVNFSFPISRFIIDIGNIMMYFLWDTAGIVHGNNIGKSITDFSSVTGVLTPNQPQNLGPTYFFIALVFLFALTFVMIAFAVLFLVRLVMLALLIVFSPIGFVGYIFPSTASYASQWWQYLMKYTFNGPIMLFMLVFAIRFMEGIQNSSIFRGVSSSASGNTGNAADAGMVATVAFGILPLVILYIAFLAGTRFGDNMSEWGRRYLNKQALRGLRGLGRLSAGGVRGLGRGAVRAVTSRDAQGNIQAFGSRPAPAMLRRLRSSIDRLDEKKSYPIVSQMKGMSIGDQIRTFRSEIESGKTQSPQRRLAIGRQLMDSGAYKEMDPQQVKTLSGILKGVDAGNYKKLITERQEAFEFKEVIASVGSDFGKMKDIVSNKDSTIGKLSKGVTPPEDVYREIVTSINSNTTLNEDGKNEADKKGYSTKLIAEVNKKVIAERNANVIVKHELQNLGNPNDPNYRGEFLKMYQRVFGNVDAKTFASQEKLFEELKDVGSQERNLFYAQLRTKFQNSPRYAQTFAENASNQTFENVQKGGAFQTQAGNQQTV